METRINTSRDTAREVLYRVLSLAASDPKSRRFDRLFDPALLEAVREAVTILPAPSLDEAKQRKLAFEKGLGRQVPEAVMCHPTAEQKALTPLGFADVGTRPPEPRSGLERHPLPSALGAIEAPAWPFYNGRTDRWYCHFITSGICCGHRWRVDRSVARRW